jgi:hypothetical protein
MFFDAQFICRSGSATAVRLFHGISEQISITFGRPSKFLKKSPNYRPRLRKYTYVCEALYRKSLFAPNSTVVAGALS